MAYYPINAKADFPPIDKSKKEEMFKTRTNQAISDANELIKELAKRHGYEFFFVKRV